MTDERLAEIEARLVAWHSFDDLTVETYDGLFRLCSPHRLQEPWVLAVETLLYRVRALEAQAALNASVVVAYEKLFNVAQRVTELPPPWARPNCKASAMHCWLADLYGVVVDVVKARLNAALAARETPPPDYRAARGCLPMAPDAEPSEVVIRRSRDAAGKGE